ncbi:hypothetical protein MFRU_007g02730 [Monilinia fructicola]|nr:hypothetical protein MFRU_007g02730 [Monilinia fructicola]
MFTRSVEGTEGYPEAPFPVAYALVLDVNVGRRRQRKEAGENIRDNAKRRRGVRMEQRQEEAEQSQ